MTRWLVMLAVTALGWGSAHAQIILDDLPSNEDLSQVVNPDLLSDIDTGAPPVINFDPNNPSSFSGCNGDPACEQALSDLGLSADPDMTDIDAIIEDAAPDGDPFGLIGPDIIGMSNLCEPLAETMMAEEVKRWEYRCESGVTVEESTSICELVLVHEVAPGYVYECPVERDAKGNIVVSEECELLDGNPSCVLERSDCSSEGGATFENVSCRVGPADVSTNPACRRERVHELSLQFIYECQFVYDEDLAEWVPDAACQAHIDSGNCTQSDGACTETDEIETEDFSCVIGDEVVYNDVVCAAVLEVSAIERPVYVTHRRWNSETQAYDPEDGYAETISAGCDIRNERCEVEELLMTETLSCHIGYVIEESSATCDADWVVTTDDDYVYAAARTWDADLGDHIASAAWNVLSWNLLEGTCRGLGETCIDVTEPAYESYTCEEGYKVETEGVTCIRDRVIEVDTDYLYSGIESWDTSTGSWSFDDAYIAGETSVEQGLGCTAGVRSCTVESPGVFKTRTCQRGYQIELNDVGVVRDLIVLTDTDYLYEGKETWSVASNGFKADASLSAVRNAGSVCAERDRTCTVEGPGVDSTYSCRAGYRDTWRNEICERPRAVSVDNDYLYQATSTWRSTVETFGDSAALTALKSSRVCELNTRLCTVDSPGLFDTQMCQMGVKKTFENDQGRRDREVVVDEDYVYDVVRNWNSSAFVETVAWSALDGDPSCETIGSICSSPTPPPYDEYSCLSGYRDDVSRQTCRINRVVTVDEDYVYTVDRSWDTARNLWTGTGNWNAVRNAGGNCQKQGDSCEITSPGVFSYHYCEQGYSIDPEVMSCRDELSFSVKTDYRYTGYSSWNGSSYRDDPTLNAMDRNTAYCKRDSRIGQDRLEDRRSWYQCQAGTIAYGSTTKCDVPLNVSVSAMTKRKYSAPNGSLPDIYVMGRPGCASAGSSAGRNNYECASAQSYWGILENGAELIYGYKYEVPDQDAGISAFWSEPRCKFISSRPLIVGTPNGPVITEILFETYICAVSMPVSNSAFEKGREKVSFFKHKVYPGSHGENRVSTRPDCWHDSTSGGFKFWMCGRQFSMESLRDDGTRTIYSEFDSWNISACPLGRDYTEVCTERRESRNINGASVLRSCWKYERTYGSTTLQSAGTCSPPSGYTFDHEVSYDPRIGESSDVKIKVYSVTESLANSENIKSAFICHTGWWRRADGSRVDVDRCTSQLAGATLVSAGCMFTEGGVCRLHAKSYQWPKPGPDNGYQKYREVWTCAKAISAEGISSPKVLKTKTGWVWDKRACNVARAAYSNGCTQTSARYVDASRSKTVDGLTLTRQWTYERSYSCEGQNAVDTCGSYAVYQPDDRPVQYASLDRSTSAPVTSSKDEVVAPFLISGRSESRLFSPVRPRAPPGLEKAFPNGLPAHEGPVLYAAVGDYEYVDQKCVNHEGSTCTKWRKRYRLEQVDPSGGCHLEQETWRCENAVSGAGTPSYERDIVSDVMDRSACDALATNNPRHALFSKRDDNNGGSRTINGLSVNRDHWSQTVTYNVTDRTHTEACQPSSAAAYHDSECEWSDPSGVCRLARKFYRTYLPDPSGGCGAYTDTFQCEERSHGTPNRLDHSIVSETFPYPDDHPMRRQCKRLSYQYGPAETRIINGMSLNKSWYIDEFYDCPVYEEVNSCGATTPNYAAEGRAALTIYPYWEATRYASFMDGVDYRSSSNPIVREATRGWLSVGSTQDYVAGDRYRLTLSAKLLGSQPVTDESVRLYIFGLDEDLYRTQYTHQLFSLSRDEQTYSLEWTLPANASARFVRPALYFNHASWQTAAPRSAQITTYQLEKLNRTDGLPVDAVEQIRICAITNPDNSCGVYNITYRYEIDDPSGGCHEWTEEYLCEEAVPAAGTPIGVPSEVDGEEWLDAACIPFSSDEQCVLQLDDCVEGPETRIIDGLEIFQACWKRTQRYECVSRRDIDSCDVPQGAVLDMSDCLWSDRAGVCRLEQLNFLLEEHDPSGGCSEWTFDYRCEEEVSSAAYYDTLTHYLSQKWDSEPYYETAANYDSCRYLSRSTCLGGLKTRDVNGVSVTRSCWSRKFDYECSVRTDAPGCDIQIGEVELSKECLWRDANDMCRLEKAVIRYEAFDASGGCHEFTTPYRCEDELQRPPPASGRIPADDEVKHVESRSWDDSVCVAANAVHEQFGASCIESERVCSEPDGRRVVDGLEVSESCWAYDVSYDCNRAQAFDSCDPPANATRADPYTACLWRDVGGTCRLFEYRYEVLQPDPTNGCSTWEQTFRCEDQLGNVGEIRETLTDIISQGWNTSACDVLDHGGKSCETTDVCTSGPETRRFGQVNVERACWSETKTYACEQEVYVDTCDVPDDATRTSDECLRDDLSFGCRLWQRDYEWRIGDGSGGCHLYAYDAFCTNTDVLARSPNRFNYKLGTSRLTKNACDAVGVNETRCREVDRQCIGSTPRSRVPTVLFNTDGVVFTASASEDVPEYTANCWEYDVSYECEDTTPVDTCSGQSYSECEQTAKTCEQFFRNGLCARFTTVYSCPVEGTGGCISRTSEFICTAETQTQTAQRGNGVVQYAFGSSSPGSLEQHLFGLDPSWPHSKSVSDVPDAAILYAQAISEPALEPTRIIATVESAYWDDAACGGFAASGTCELVSSACLGEESGNLEPIRRAQDDYHQQYIGNAASMVEECWEEENIYECGVTSTMPACTPGVEGCSVSAEVCRIFDGDGNCLLSENSYSCQTDICEPSRRICDERKGNERYVGFKYTCSVVRYEEDGEFDPYRSSNTCLGMTGCEQVLLFQAIERVFVDRRENGETVIQDDMDRITSERWAYYCSGEQPHAQPAVVERGYVEGEGLDAETATCSDISSYSDCTVLEETCVMGKVLVTLEGIPVPNTSICDGDRRIIYDCSVGNMSGEGEAGCSGDCESWTDRYVCDGEVDGAGDPTQQTDPDIVSRIDSSRCNALNDSESCVVEKEVCVEGPDIRLVSAVPVQADCWRWERTYRCEVETGTANSCEIPAACSWIEDNCLGSDEEGRCLTTEHVYQCEEVSEEIVEAGSDGTCEPGAADAPYNDPNEAGTLGGSSLFDIVAALNSVREGSDDYQTEPDLFGGEGLKCSKWVFGAKNCCKRSGLLIGLGCSENEAKLQTSRQEDLCISVGSYCSKKALFGACLKKKETYCCYKSELARIVVEAGIRQQGKDLGTPKNPSCDGFTVEQFQLLNLGDADFSSVADNMLEDMNLGDPDEIADRMRRRIQEMQGGGG